MILFTDFRSHGRHFVSSQAEIFGNLKLNKRTFLEPDSCDVICGGQSRGRATLTIANGTPTCRLDTRTAAGVVLHLQQVGRNTYALAGATFTEQRVPDHEYC